MGRGISVAPVKFISAQQQMSDGVCNLSFFVKWIVALQILYSYVLVGQSTGTSSTSFAGRMTVVCQLSLRSNKGKFSLQSYCDHPFIVLIFVSLGSTLRFIMLLCGFLGGL